MDTDAYLGAAFEYNAGATKLQIDGNFTLNDNEKEEFMSNVTDVKVMRKMILNKQPKNSLKSVCGV